MERIEFSSIIVPIDNKVKGLIRLSIEPKIKFLELKSEVHMLMFDLNDNDLVNTLMKSIVDQCDINPINNDSIFNSVSSKIVSQDTYNYYQLEELSEFFSFINSYKDLNEIVTIPEIFGVRTVSLLVRDIKRLQRYVNGFLFNYQIILDTLRYVDKKSEMISLKPREEGLFIEAAPPAEIEESNEIIIEKNTRIDDILEFLVISPQILGYAIHLIFNFYNSINNSEISKVQDNKFIFKFGGIFPTDLSVNRAYVMGLTEAVDDVSLDKINLLMKNLVKYLVNYHEELSGVELSLILMALFFFSLRHLTETHRTWVFSNLDQVFCDKQFQCKMLNKYTEKVSGIPIKFEVEENFGELEDELEVVSNKYSYLKEIDQNKFADLVFGEVTDVENNPTGCCLGIKNIINIDKFIKNKQQDSEFIDVSAKLRQENLLLGYKKSSKDPKIITHAFDTFLKFLENPLIIVTDKKISIPPDILNSFEKLKNILNDQNFRKEDINTLHYYQKLVEVLPEDFPFLAVLFIIYQIVIPYMYFFYGIQCFEDCFLTTYRI